MNEHIDTIFRKARVTHAHGKRNKVAYIRTDDRQRFMAVCEKLSKPVRFAEKISCKSGGHISQLCFRRAQAGLSAFVPAWAIEQSNSFLLPFSAVLLAEESAPCTAVTDEPYSPDALLGGLITDVQHSLSQRTQLPIKLFSNNVFEEVEL